MELDIKVINQYIGALALENYLLRSQVEEQATELTRRQTIIDERRARVVELERHIEELRNAVT